MEMHLALILQESILGDLLAAHIIKFLSSLKNAGAAWAPERNDDLHFLFFPAKIKFKISKTYVEMFNDILHCLRTLNFVIRFIFL